MNPESGAPSVAVVDPALEVSLPAGSLAVVTGGAGFIGSHLVDALIARGLRVRVFDDLSSGSLENLAAAVEFLAGDIADAAACRAACRGARLVFHQAALGSVPRSFADPGKTLSSNVAGTARVLEAARVEGVERVVLASSSSVYGDADGLLRVEGEEGRATSPYALSKQMGERLVEFYARSYGMAVVALRYFNVFGPRQSPAGPYAAVIPRFLAAARAGLPLEVHGGGGQVRDFTFVADAVAANLRAAVASPAAFGRGFNVGTGVGTSVLQLAQLVGDILGEPASPRFVAERVGDVARSVADLTAARELLGHEPSTSLRAGLRLTARTLARPPIEPATAVAEGDRAAW